MCIRRLSRDNGGYCMSNNDSRMPEHGAGWGVGGGGGGGGGGWKGRNSRGYVAKDTTLLNLDSAGNHIFL